MLGAVLMSRSVVEVISLESLVVVIVVLLLNHLNVLCFLHVVPLSLNINMKVCYDNDVK